MSEIAELYLAGDKAGATEKNGELYAIILAMQEKQAAFSEALNTATHELAAERIEATGALQTMSRIISLIFIVVGVSTGLIIGFTVVRPARNATNHLNRIIRDIQNNEGDLTQRIAVSTQDEVASWWRVSTVLSTSFRQQCGKFRPVPSIWMSR